MKNSETANANIQLKVFTLIFFLLIPVFLIGQNKTDTIAFIHITDVHFCNLAGYHPVIAQSRQHYGDVTGPLISFFRSVPEKMQSDFIVMTGDMIDYYEGETALGEMLDTQVEQFARLLDKTHIPVYLTLNKYFLDLEDTVAIKHRLEEPGKDTLDLFSVLRQNSSVRLVISGHRHSCVTHEVHLSDDYSLTHVMTGAFGRDPRNWRQIQLTGSSIIISFPGDTRSQYTISLN